MKSIVITGSTRGIGFGLANSFLGLGCAVTVSGRTPPAVAAAVEKLGARHDPARVFGHPCDVTDYDQVQALWDAAHTHWGTIDIWINNAGISSMPSNVWEHSPEVMHDVVGTNIIGTLYGCRVALRGMLAQGSGSVYNLEGVGSDGRHLKGETLYGMTKRALRYLDEALAEETKGTPLIVGALLPGIVMTDMFTSHYKDNPEEWAKVKPMFNIISDRPETVTPWLARRTLENRKNGARIAWLNPFKIATRFLTAPVHKRNVVD